MLFRRASLALLFLLLFLSPFLAWASPAPDLEVKQAEFDFGEIYQGEKVDHVFTFRNKGDAPLQIDRVKSSCGCTAALLSAKVIAPGDEGTIRASFDSSRFRGAVTKVIYLYSNAPGKETTRFSIKGVIKPLVEFRPALIEFGAVPQDGERSVDFVLVNAGEKELLIQNVRASNTAFSAEAEAEVMAPGAEVRFTAYARPINSTPHLRGHILIRTDNAGLGEIRVPARGTIIRPDGK